MKKLIVVVSIGMLLLISGCEKKVGVNKVAELLPSNTLFFLKLNSLEILYENFSITGDSVFGNKVDGGEHFNEWLGFNPMNIEAVKNLGIDTGKDLGIGIVDLEIDTRLEGPSKFNGILFIPVTDGSKVEKKIEELMSKYTPDKKLSRDGNIVSFPQNTKEKNACFMIKDNYFLLAISHNYDSKDLLKSIGKTSLLKSKNYQKVVSKVDSEKALFLFGNIKSFFDSNAALFENLKSKSKGHSKFFGLDLVSGYESSGVSIDFEGPDLVIENAACIAKNSKILQITEPVTFNKKTIIGIKDKPVMIISFAMNFHGYYQMLLNSLPQGVSEEAKAKLEMVKAKTEIDLEKELLENLAGNINLGLFDGAKINLMNYNTVLTINLKDEKTMKNLIEKAINMIPPTEKSMVRKETIEGIDTVVLGTPMVQGYVGIKDRNLIVAVGKSMYEKSLKGTVSTGFTADLDDKELVDAFRGNMGVFYVDISELLKVFKNFSGFITKELDEDDKETMSSIIEAVKKVKYILATDKFEKNIETKRFIIKTAFTEPFFLGIQKIIKSFQPQG